VANRSGVEPVNTAASEKKSYGWVALVIVVLFGASTFAGFQLYKHRLSNNSAKQSFAAKTALHQKKSSAELGISWDSPQGESLARKIGNSDRLSDIAAYLLHSQGERTLSSDDYQLLEIAQREIEFDETLGMAYAKMVKQGYAEEVMKTDYGFNVRGLWELHAEANSPFREIFPAGGRNLMHGESLLMPQCKSGFKPAIVYALMSKKGAKRVPVKIVPEPGQWRVLLPSADMEQSYQYRVLADAGCMKGEQPKADVKK
jgi:hypothetical protein